MGMVSDLIWQFALDLIPPSHNFGSHSTLGIRSYSMISSALIPPCDLELILHPRATIGNVKLYMNWILCKTENCLDFVSYTFTTIVNQVFFEIWNFEIWALKKVHVTFFMKTNKSLLIALSFYKFWKMQIFSRILTLIPKFRGFASNICPNSRFEDKKIIIRRWNKGRMPQMAPNDLVSSTRLQLRKYYLRYSRLQYHDWD